MSHSYGGNVALHALNQFEQKFKDDHIDVWVPTAVPFSGNSELIKSHLNADDEGLKDIFSLFE